MSIVPLTPAMLAQPGPDLNGYFTGQTQELGLAAAAPPITPVSMPDLSGQGSGSVAAADGFTQALTTAIGSVAGLQQNADQAVAGLALNQGVDVHEAMIAMEQASLGMHLAVQVRDKAVEAYQSMINMQM